MIPGPEDTYAEQPAIEWLKELGWKYIPGPEIAPDGPEPERDIWSDVALIGRLRAAVAEINPELPIESVTQVVDRIMTTESPTPIEDHAGFHEFLTAGVPISYLDSEGMERSTRAKLVDFQRPERNDFLVVNQFTIIEGQKNRRPDLLLFVNGLPLAQIELKNPADESATAKAAVNQVSEYQMVIPRLYRFVEIVAVSDLLQARAGTITTPAEHFASWKSMDPAADEGKPALEVLLKGMFDPSRFLDLVENFVLFESDGSKTQKILAKYHQVDAANKAVEATAQAMEEEGRGGVVWHTQGAGKSYSMVFYTAKLRSDPRFENPTIVAVTDRVDLDNQLLQVFSRQPGLAPSIRHAESIDTGAESLRSLLNVPAGGIVFTTIQKFAESSEGEPMPVISERRNIVVVADEAHRSQYDTFAQNITKALPNATRIGFTGTPIEKADRSTRLVFGDYISIYRITQAVEDGATVPIYYESHVVPIDVDDPSLLREVEEVLEDEEQEASSKVVTNWTKLEKLVGSAPRLDRVATDIADHYVERCKNLDGKAIVVGMSRRICAELAKRLKKELGDEAVTCVMSAAATDDPLLSRYRRNKREMRQVAEDFKDPDHLLKVVVVRDMWLTGFDVPPLHTMYVDKPMRDHGLLQAIARVNRVFKDKPGGLVVDYIGIGEDLRSSLSAYTADVVEEAMIPFKDAISKMREKHDILCEFFHGIDFRGRHGLEPIDRARLLQEAHTRAIGDEEKTKRFLENQAAFARWFSLVSPDQAAIDLRNDAKFFAEIASSVRKYTPPSGEPDPEAEQKVKQFFSEGLAAGEIVDIFGLAGKERPEISVLSDEFLDEISTNVSQPDLQVALLKKLLNDEIRVSSGRNTMQAKLFGEEFEALLARYSNRQLTSAEVVEQLVELAKKMREGRRRPEKLGLTEEETAFYDALAGGSEDWKVDPELAKIARALVENIRNDLTVDWANHENTEAAIRRKIKRLLRRYKYKPPARATSGGAKTGRGRNIDFAAKVILDQARVLYRYWPEIEVGEPFI